MSSFAIDIPAALIERLRRGDARAYEQAYRLFERPVFSLAWRMLGDRDEAQEILHDALLQVFNRIAQYRAEAPFWAWLRQIVVNESLMRLRKRRLEYVEETPEPEAALMQCHQMSLDRADLERALGGLTPMTRSIVWLYYVEGYTHEEIAKSFDKTVSFSKSQVSRGTQRMRELLDVGAEVLAYA